MRTTVPSKTSRAVAFLPAKRLPGINGWRGARRAVGRDGVRRTAAMLDDAWASEEAAEGAAEGAAELEEAAELDGGGKYEDVCRWDDATSTCMPIRTFLAALNYSEFAGWCTFTTSFIEIELTFSSYSLPPFFHRTLTKMKLTRLFFSYVPGSTQIFSSMRLASSLLGSCTTTTTTPYRFRLIVERKSPPPSCSDAR
jgi:hypothetical protein